MTAAGLCGGLCGALPTPAEQSICIATAVAIGAVVSCERLDTLAVSLVAHAGGRESLLRQLLRLAEKAPHIPLRTEALNVIAKAVKSYAPELR